MSDCKREEGLLADANASASPGLAESPAVSVLLVYLLFLSGVMHNWGFFTWHGLILVIAAMSLAVRFHLRPLQGSISSQGLLRALFLGSVIASCIFQSGQHQATIRYAMPGIAAEKFTLTAPGIAIKVLNACAVLMALAWTLRPASRRAVHWALGLAAIAIAMRILMLFSTLEPRIDLYFCQTYGAQGLLDGRNPYNMTFPSPYEGQTEFSHYPYPPLTILANAASWLLFKDVRGLWVVLDLVAGLMLYFVARRLNPDPRHFARNAMLALVFLYMPKSLFVIEQAYTEPLVVATMGGFALALMAGSNLLFLGALLGLWVSSKQYVMVAMPLLLWTRRCRAPAWIAAVVLAAGLLLPFALWNPDALYRNMLGFFIGSPVRGDALSLFGVAWRLHLDIPWPVVVAVWAAAILFFMRTARASHGGWLFATACTWMAFFLFGKQACINYFYVILYALLLAAAAIPTAPTPSNEAAGAC